MTFHRPPYRLKVQQIKQFCLFELTWGQGQQLAATLPYPATVMAAYQEWQQLYLNFYNTAQMPPMPPVEDTALRGRVLESGSLTPSTNWHPRLVQAEAKLLSEFHYWLQSAELYEIRKEIARSRQYDSGANSLGANSLGASSSGTGSPRAELRVQQSLQESLTLFLTCSPMDLARLPWEAWEIGAEFAMSGAIYIVRSPVNIHLTSLNPSENPSRRRQNRVRILAILGDETGLNFQADKQSVRSLSRIAEVEFVGWQPGKSASEVQAEICTALEDDRGWDVLFFAGHSNETQMTGGELVIAPGVALAIREIASRLTIAKQHGLQFALFNSCSGLRIAECLIDLGFSQVAVMREPIHNRVAQEFLVSFLQSLAQHKNVHESLLSACQILKLDKNITYPSAYLVPSLFCHPGAMLFQIPRSGWKQWLQGWKPERYEAIVLIVSLLLALLPPVHTLLLDQRLLVQAIYRQITAQIPPSGSPPVALVLIDDASTREDPRLTNPAPIDRSYLADLIRQLTQRGVRIIGIDYLLDRQTGREAELNQALQQAVTQQHTWFIFGTLYDPFEAEGIFTTERPGIAQRAWSMQGYVTLLPDRVTLPFPTEDCRKTCPFAYLLALTQTANQNGILAPPQLNTTGDLRTQLLEAIDAEPSPKPSLTALKQARLNDWSAFTSEILHQVSLEPIIDFSIPPDRVYQGISAWEVLQDRSVELSQSHQVVIIGAGDYTDGGEVEQGKLDLFPIPAAVTYWREQLPADHLAQFSSRITGREEQGREKHYLRFYTGAEAHAYMVHHLLNQRLVVPIPTLWMMGLAIVLGKGTTLLLRRTHYPTQWTRSKRRSLIGGLIGATLVYGIASLQLYITMAVLSPWILPSGLFWTYMLSALRRRTPYV